MLIYTGIPGENWCSWKYVIDQFVKIVNLKLDTIYQFILSSSEAMAWALTYDASESQENYQA